MQHPSAAPPSHHDRLKELYADIRARGLLEPTHHWRWKLGVWLPAFLLSYLAMVVLPVGPLWLALAPLCAVAILTMGFAGHDAGHYALSRKRWVNDLWGQIAMTL